MKPLNGLFYQGEKPSVLCSGFLKSSLSPLPTLKSVPRGRTRVILAGMPALLLTLCLAACKRVNSQHLTEPSGARLSVPCLQKKEPGLREAEVLRQEAELPCYYGTGWC